MTRRLYRTVENKHLGGVCGGLAEYFDLDPVLVRLLAVVGLFASAGTAVIIYIIGWVIIPDKREVFGTSTPPPASNDSEATHSNPKWHSLLPGIILVGLGLVLLIREYVFWFGFDELWPVLLIILGTALIAYGLLRRGRRMAEVEESRVSTNGASNGSSQNGGGA